VPDRKIQTVHVAETPLQRRHGLGTVIVDTAAGGTFKDARVVDLGRSEAMALLGEVGARAAAGR
jgi:uncharacterized membrane protein YdbT with pleckstrin-like domain